MERTSTTCPVCWPSNPSGKTVSTRRLSRCPRGRSLTDLRVRTHGVEERLEELPNVVDTPDDLPGTHEVIRRRAGEGGQHRIDVLVALAEEVGGECLLARGDDLGRQHGHPFDICTRCDVERRSTRSWRDRFPAAIDVGPADTVEPGDSTPGREREPRRTTGSSRILSVGTWHGIPHLFCGLGSGGPWVAEPHHTATGIGLAQTGTVEPTVWMAASAGPGSTISR